MMMQRGKAGALALRVLTVLALFGAAACSNPVEVEEHPEGLLIVNAQGQEVASFNHGTGTVVGTVTVAAGTPQTFQVFFLGHEGERIPVQGAEFALGVPTVANTALASVAREGADGLRITGTAVGATELVVPALHGNHEEFRATLPLSVTQ